MAKYGYIHHISLISPYFTNITIFGHIWLYLVILVICGHIGGIPPDMAIYSPNPPILSSLYGPYVHMYTHVYTSLAKYDHIHPNMTKMTKMDIPMDPKRGSKNDPFLDTPNIHFWTTFDTPITVEAKFGWEAK